MQLKRVFIVTPMSSFIEDDTVYHVCTHNGKMSVEDTYFNDKYEVQRSFSKLEPAIKYAKKQFKKRK